MEMTYTKSAFEMPDGKYLARFLGVTMREDEPGAKPRLGNDGKPMGPAMTWDFEIADGPEQGKKADKLTGRLPTPKSGCGKMLVAISDRVLKEGEKVNLDEFVGRFYRITVIDNRVSDNPGPVLERTAVPPAQAPVSTTATIGNPGPNAGDPNARWDASDGAAVMLNKSSAEVQAILNEAKAAATTIRVKPAGADRSLARTADQYGFINGDTVPW